MTVIRPVYTDYSRIYKLKDESGFNIHVYESENMRIDPTKLMTNVSCLLW